jgi:predicted acylesterase/phospholipase RssA
MSNGDFDPMRQFGQIWLEMLSKSGSLFGQLKPGEPPPEAARQFRGAVFKSMADQADQFMRSETFLQSMKQSLDAALNFQKQYQTMLTEFRHSTEGVAASDVDAAMIMLRQMESRVLDRLEDLDARLKGIADRLDQLESTPQTSGSNP